MKLALNLMPNAPLGQLAELAALADGLGYERCWVNDEGMASRDVYVTLTAIAAATERLRLGPGITNPFVRHPGATAGAIATIDEFSGGRAFLGLGAGGGLTLGPLAVARDRPLGAVRSTIGALRSLFAGETVTVNEPPVTFDRARLFAPRPDLEIIVAGRGPRMLALAGELADGCYLSYLHRDSLGAVVSDLRSAASARNVPFVVTYTTIVATNDAEFDEARAQLTFRLVDSPLAVRERIGLTPADADAIREALAEGGPANAAPLMRDEWVEPFIIAGSSVDCAARLRSLADELGIDEYQLPIFSADTAADRIERLAALFG